MVVVLPRCCGGGGDCGGCRPQWELSGAGGTGGLSSGAGGCDGVSLSILGGVVVVGGDDDDDGVVVLKVRRS